LVTELVSVSSIALTYEGLAPCHSQTITIITVHTLTVDAGFASLSREVSCTCAGEVTTINCTCAIVTARVWGNKELCSPLLQTLADNEVES